MGSLKRVEVFEHSNAATAISGFPRHVDEICALLGYYAASRGNCLPTFRDNVSVPSSRAKSPRRPLKVVPIRCPETSVNNYHTTPCDIEEECRSHSSVSTIGPILVRGRGHVMARFPVHRRFPMCDSVFVHAFNGNGKNCRVRSVRSHNTFWPDSYIRSASVLI
jgi:hypothetical protein